MTPARERIRLLLDEAEQLEPVAEQEERDEAMRLALEEERRSNEWRAALGRMHGKEAMGQPLSVLADTTGVEQAAQAEADNSLIDQTLATLDVA